MLQHKPGSPGSLLMPQGAELSTASWGKWRSITASSDALTQCWWCGCCSPLAAGVSVAWWEACNFHIFPSTSLNYVRGYVKLAQGHILVTWFILTSCLILSVQHILTMLQCYRSLHCWESRKKLGFKSAKKKIQNTDLSFWLSGLQHLRLQNNCVSHLCLTGCVTQLKFNRQIQPCRFSEWNGLFGSGLATAPATNITFTPGVSFLLCWELSSDHMLSRIFCLQEELHHCFWWAHQLCGAVFRLGVQFWKYLLKLR